MYLAIASKIPLLVNSSGTVTDIKVNLRWLSCMASRLAFFTPSGMQRKLSSMGGVAAPHLFSYSSKWWPAMWPRHVEFNPRRKQALSVLFDRVPFSIIFSVSSLGRHVSNDPLLSDAAYSPAKFTPSSSHHLNLPCLSLLKSNLHSVGEDRKKVACRVLLKSDRAQSPLGLVLIEVLSWIGELVNALIIRSTNFLFQFSFIFFNLNNLKFRLLCLTVVNLLNCLSFRFSHAFACGALALSP